MACTIITKRPKRSVLFALLILLLVVGDTQCGRGGGGSRSSGGGSRSSSGGGYRGSSSSGGYRGSSGTGHSSSSGGGYHSTSHNTGTSHTSSGGYHGTSGSTRYGSTGSSHTPVSSSNNDFYRQNTGRQQTSSSGSGGGNDFYRTNTGTKPGGIGFDHVNQQTASNHGTAVHSTNVNPLNNAKPFNPSAPPGYTVQGGTGYIPSSSSGTKPGSGGNDFYRSNANQQSGGSKPIGFDNVNQQAINSRGGGGTHSTNVNPSNGAKPFNPSAPPGYNVQGGTGFVPGGNTQTHVNPVGSGRPGSVGGGGGGSKPGDIGFDHLNKQAAQNTGGINRQSTYQQHGGYPNTHQYQQPYRPQTYTQPGSSYVHYQPPTQLQYQPPPVIQSTTHHHYVPVYQPVYAQQSSGGGSLLGYGGSFLGGYLVGRLSGSSYGYGGGYGGFGGYGHDHHTTYNTYNNYGSSDRGSYGGNSNYDNNNNRGYDGNQGQVGGGGGGDGNVYYTVHNYNQNKPPAQFSVPGESIKECSANTSMLCAPNTNAFCLNNGTIMCVTPSSLTSPCQANSTDKCVYTKVDCTGHPDCPTNQTFVEFYLPCMATATYKDNKILDSSVQQQNGTNSYELCVTAIANPQKLESPVGATVAFLAEIGKWHLQKLSELGKSSNTVYGAK